MPFFYLNDPACAYYLGGYLLHLAEAFDDEYISCLAPVHFTSLMGHARFSSIIQQLSREQQLVLGEFSTAMLENSDLFWLDEALSAKLREGVTLLTGA